MKIRHIILSISLLFMGLFITSCTDCSGDACLHNNNSWIVEKQSTCLQNGIRKKQCLDCKKIFKTETISKLEHQFEWIIDIEPTNEDEGLKHLECIQCHTIKDNTSIVSLSHVHEATHVLENKPTCTKDGNIEYYYCKTCNKYFTDSTLENEIAKDDTIKKATHELAFYKGQEATCFESGYNDYYTCLNCDYTTYQEIKPLGHEYQNEKCIRCQIEQFLYFGEYPQTLKEESVTIITDTPDDTGYYLGSDNNRYAKVVATPYNDSTYFNNKTTIVEGNIYYFKVEPIKWDVLEKNNQEYRLFSHLILDNQIFHNTYYDVLYQSSDIRNWLNNEFYNKAFSEIVKSYIIKTLVKNKEENNPYQSNDLLDYVYLPSVDEMTNYEFGYTLNGQEYDLLRQKQLTDYAKEKGCFASSGKSYNNGYYWLRTPLNCDDYYTHYVSFNGYIYSDKIITCDYIGVVPGLVITIE